MKLSSFEICANHKMIDAKTPCNFIMELGFLDYWPSKNARMYWLEYI